MAGQDNVAELIPASDSSLLVRFGEDISLQAHHRVIRFLRLLSQEPLAGVQNLHPGYCSVLVRFDLLQYGIEELIPLLQDYVERSVSLPVPEAREVEIPVCYGGEFGPDLESVAASRGMHPRKVMELHSSATYFACFLGFAPGFAYLGGLPAALATPRLDTPRKSVPAGSVGIGGSQTGVYPLSAPGGWRIIGRTPLALFKAVRNPPSLIQIGDWVRFVPVSESLFRSIELLCQ